MKDPLRVVVVGSGVAGMAFALRLSALMRERPVAIHILSKAAPERSNSFAAQGGVAAVIQPSDSWQKHRDDTLAVGDERCDPQVVERVVKEGPACIRELLENGARFDMDPQGRLNAAREGGHSAARVVHRGDRTGAELVRVLQQHVGLDPNIQVSDTLLALDLLVADEPGGRRCHGVRAMDTRTGAMANYSAAVVVLATGGAGQVYRHTTNPSGATGSGVAMAIRAGVPLRDMAFVQFHPTALYAPGEEGTFLISEALRGAGAILLKPDGTPLMKGLHPMADLAPRNVVARAIHAVMQKTGAPHVWLDARQVGRARLAREFPMIMDHCWSLGLDPCTQLIPVMPAAHYLCGGIRTDADGRTALHGLYALGECAGSGLHGADRLASNSLLEALVIPRYAAASVMDSPWMPAPGGGAPAGRYALMEPSGTVLGLRRELQGCMMDHVGIIRTDAGLQQAAVAIQAIQRGADRQWDAGERSIELLELRDLVRVAGAIGAQAMAETTNAGAHWNVDHVVTHTRESVPLRG